MLNPRVCAVRSFIEEWQRELARLVQEPGNGHGGSGFGLAIGRCVIWPCLDAAVVLIYRAPDRSISVEVRLPTWLPVAKFTNSAQAMRFYDQDGHWKPGYPSLSVVNDLQNEFRRIGGGLGFANVTGHPGKQFYQRFDNAVAVGWDADLSDPAQVALEYFQQQVASINVSAQKPSEGRERYFDLLAQFKLLLDSADKEEEIQAFLKANPVLLYPTHIRVLPKFKLGSEHVTDFVFVVHTAKGTEWVFVEIERSDKRLFTRNGQFSSEFTQAKNQLLDWEAFVDDYRNYLDKDLPGIRSPVYHLICGRDSALSPEQKEKLRREAKPNQILSTYDDILRSFETLIRRLFP